MIQQKKKEFSLDLDQNENKIKLELDKDLEQKIKYEKTETGFLTDFPSKDNLGEQPIQIYTDDKEIRNNINQETDTNYERPIVILPTSNLNRQKRKQKIEQSKRFKKAFILPEKYPEKARTITESMKYLKELKNNKPNLFEESESKIDFEEFAPNIEKYLKKNRQIDMCMLKKRKQKNEESKSKKAFVLPEKYPEPRTLNQSMKYLKELKNNKPKLFKESESQINFEEFAPNIEKYLKKNRQIDIRKLNNENRTKAVIPTVKKKVKKNKSEELDLDEFAPNIEKYLKKNRQIDIRNVKIKKPKPVIKKKKSKDKLTNIDLEEFAPNIEKYFKKKTEK